MEDDFLTLDDELILAAPLHLDDDLHVCDRRFCDARAEVIVPGCVLCHDCASEFGAGVARVYNIPLSELTFCDFRFIRARSEEYAALLAEHRARLLLPTSPEKERLVRDLIRDGVDELIRFCGGQP